MTTWDIIAALKKNKVVPRLAGDQLKLVGETQSLPKELLDQVRDRKEELRAFLKEAMDQQAFAPIPLVARQEHYAASNAQKRIWVLSQLDGGNAAYNIVRSFYLKGKVVKENLERAFQLTVQRHESLRTVFKEINGELRQVVLENLLFKIHYKEHVSDEELNSEVERAGCMKFDLEHGPLLSVKLYRLSDKEYAMIFNIHHIISDGWSIGVLVPEVMRAYRELCEGRETLLAPLSIQYKDYCEWHGRRLEGERSEQARGFWKLQFAEMPDALELPADAQRPATRSFEGSVARFYPGKELFAGIQAFCREHHITAFNFFRATLTLLLGRLTGQQDVVIGSPASGRNHSDLEGQVGLYINTLPLRAQVNADEPFNEFLKKVTEHSFRAFQFQDYPFDNIIEDLTVRRDTSRNPLFDVMLAVQDAAIGEGSVNKHQQYGFELNLLNRYLYPGGQHEEKVAAKFDLTFNLDYEPDNTFYIEIEYDSRLFRKERISGIFGSYMHVIEQVMREPGKLVREIEITVPGEKKKILEEFNSPVEEIPEQSILELLRWENKVAIIANDAETTYEQLNEASERIAGYLKGRKFVGLLMGRTEKTIAAILGILKAGAAYVPIDITYPASRIEYIIHDAKLEIILTDDEGLKVAPAGYSGQLIHVDNAKGDAVKAAIDPEQTAYVIYTSGSTGNPKGVEICHRNTIAFLKWCQREFSQTPYEILYATTSYCFDLSVFEFLFPLMQGKTIRMLKSAMEITDWVEHDERILINTVPSVVRNLMGMNWSNVVALNIAGEPVPPNFKTDLDHKRIEVRNLYGPTEDTTYSTVYRFADDGHTSIPIGSSIDHSQLYILDAFGNLQPVGVYGEIYLGGQSVAKGYLNKPELTAERFLPNPFLPGTTMYKTGDIGRWLHDGLVEYAGRTDDQVKIRGHRIEPGEVQYRLEQHPLVRQAVVVVRKIEGDDALVAYVSGDSSLNTALLKDHLSAILPAYMVPGYWMILDEIPLNSNGKVDKKRLPLPAAFAGETVMAEPETELQRKLMLLWKKLITAASFGITDNFFDIGGHSLKAIKLRFLVQEELGVDITLNEIFACPTIEKQSHLLESRPLAVVSPIEVIEQQETYPISPAQERLWVLTKFRDASVAYNMPAVYKVHGTLDVERLQQAFNLVIDRYEILRTVFSDKGDAPVQQVLSSINIEISNEEIPLQHPFDLEHGPLLRCTFNGQFLTFNMHHIISDGWSLGILYQNIVEAYNKLEPLPALPVQYKDYAAWQRKQDLEEHLHFWLEQFKEELQPLELPADFNRPEVKTYKGDTRQFLLNSKILETGRLAGASDFMTLMAAVRVLLKKYSGQQDIVIGTPVSGRNHPQLQDQIGFFVNSLPIRVKTNSAESFLSLLEHEKQAILAALEHQDLSFETLVEALQLKRDLSRSPLFDVMLVLQDAEEKLNDFAPGIQLERINAATGISKYDLLFSFAKQEDGLMLTVEFNTDLFLPATIERMIRHFGRVIEQVTFSPQILIKDIILPDAEECAVLASKADQTNFSFDEDATIVSLFNKAVQLNPHKTALVFGDGSMTYEELDIKSGQLAAILLDSIKPEELIILHFHRNEWMLIAILGVLKAGAAYVPVDPDYPPARTNYILQDSGSRLILSDTTEIKFEGTIIDITNLEYTGPTAAATVKPSHLAYVIYTSGTTGNPKGVLIEHRQVTRLLFHEGNLYDFNEHDVWSLFHSYCFDFSVWEMYGALLYGGALVIVPKHTAQDGRAFYDFLLQHKVTVLNQTPTAFRSMLQANSGRISSAVKVRYLIFGGEALMPAVLKPWKQTAPQCRIINMYGITETTVHVTFKEITDKEIADNQSNIGLPMPTVSCFVLDADLQQVPIGVTGELCVGGQGVARGYLNRPELTAAKFIAHPFKLGERMYRSGDFARILSNGDIEYIGRRDDQVKIRGHRIEPAEVEAAIIHQPGIKDAVVLTLKSMAGEYELAGYFIPEQDFESTAQLRKSLNELLPSYMVPSYLIPLHEFPVNSNGKLDKTALPSPQEIIKEQTTQVSSRNETDRAIMAIWEAVLERKGIGIRDNFFDLGGHSLKATRVVSRIHETMGVKIDLKALFMEPTIENLSNYVETVRWMENKDEVLAGSQDEIIF